MAHPKSLAASATLIVASMLAPGVAGAQQFPSKMIRIISPAAAGGLTDVLARSLAEDMQRGSGRSGAAW